MDEVGKDDQNQVPRPSVQQMNVQITWSVRQRRTINKDGCSGSQRVSGPEELVSAWRAAGFATIQSQVQQQTLE